MLDGFDWDVGNWPKCGKHGVPRDVIEALFESRPAVLDNDRHGGTERRFSAIGQVNGRWLFVVFSIRNNRIRPISARFMHEREVRHYEEDR